jgi:hypothetical protein
MAPEKLAATVPASSRDRRANLTPQQLLDLRPCSA